MKIIVTGSEGFIGTELVRQCLREGIEVIGFDLLKKNELSYGFKIGDVRDSAIADSFPEDADAIVHLAALSRDSQCAGKPYECFATNVMGLLNVMRIAQAKKAKQLIFPSSEWVYEKFVGDEEKDEDSFIDITGHTSEYALSKLVSEANLREQYKRGFIPVTILRFAIVYGPRKDDWCAVESVADDVKRNDTVTLMRSRKSGRRFVHVVDIARGIRLAFGRNDFQIFNLSGDEMITMGDVVSESEKLFHKKVKVIESNPHDANMRNPSNKKAKELLGWKPEIGFKEGIKTIDPYTSTLGS
ncbi:MAG: NAD(P)-dependent oxidoreductase [Candidatus Liptonbacteria bacterium]|nr:NAD(P)-dependent oxidoreductase [Candidatus Liptonbacteria bacterium]